MDRETTAVRTDFVVAVAWYRKAADQNIAGAQFNLGNMFYYGQGVSQDYAQAVAWYRKAADQQSAKAQFNLGNMYYHGQGVQQDYPQAVAWYRKAAGQEIADAEYNIGVMYVKGYGVPQDYEQAASWYRKAADQGYASAQYSLGLIYANGVGLPEDYAQAHMWLNLAALRASDASIRNMAVKLRDEIAAKMTPAQIAEAQRMAREWVPIRKQTNKRHKTTAQIDKAVSEPAALRSLLGRRPGNRAGRSSAAGRNFLGRLA